MNDNPAPDVAQLLAEKEQLEFRLAQVDVELKTGRRRSEGTHRKQIPLRGLVLDSLQDLGVMAYSRELALYIGAQYERRVEPTRFGTLGKNELDAFGSKRPRPVYLCHGLTHARGEAIKRLWARSDWPLHERVVAPTTGRVQHLRMTVALCGLAAREERGEPGTLKILAADHARDIPGVKVRRGEFPLDEWSGAANELLSELLALDEAARKEAASLLHERLGDQQLLFGVEDSTLTVVRDSGHEAIAQ